MAIRKVLISQPKPERVNSPYFDIAKKYKLELTFQPFIKVETLSSLEFREQKIRLSDYTAIIFNTRTAIEHFFALANELRITLPEDTRYFCLSEQVANYLQKFTTFRKRRVYFPKESKNSELAKLIAKYPKEKYFLPVTEDYKRDLLDLLEAESISAQAGVMFRTVPVELPAEIKEDDYDIIMLFTPIGVKSLQKNFPHLDSQKSKLAAFGPKTAKAIQEASYELSIEAPTPTCPTMTKALEQYLSKQKK